MILDDLKVIDPPDVEWVTRLRHGHFVFLVKENRFAEVEWAYELPEPGMLTGYIGIRPCARSSAGWWLEPTQRWYISPGGNGIDGKPILRPVAGNCPAESPPISEPWQRHVERAINSLVSRVDRLEAAMSRVYTGDALVAPPLTREMMDEVTRLLTRLEEGGDRDDV